ncbi:MAG TPA: hypothetical protein VIG90_09565 [Pedomonas sp.]|uniref:hypothetical protein n=1 Tax=Pedomonas sp. TaxID=2976421 RepID=UPI002F4108DC
MTEAEKRRRRLEAKRHNEQWKVTATFLNNIAAAFLIGAFVTPVVTSGSTTTSAIWLIVSAWVHLAARFVLMRLESED